MHPSRPRPIAFVLVLAGCAAAPEVASVAEPATAPGPAAWWDHWPRVTHHGHVADATRTNSDLVNVGDLFLDDGRGPWYREVLDNSPGQQSERAAATSAGVHRLAWIFGQGSSRAIITSELYDYCERAYDDIDPITNAPRIEVESFGWDTCGPTHDNESCGDDAPPGCNASDEVHWASMPLYFAADPIQGRFVWPGYSPLPAPTWAPLGSHTGDPVGFTDYDDPRTALLYDAVGAKDIFGRLSIDYWQPVHTNTYYTLATDPVTGATIDNGDFIVGKDIAADASAFWLALSRESIGYLLAHGANGFWQDNSSGWGDFGSQPTGRGFGDWSVTGFRAYAGTSSTFDIRADLKAQFQTWFGYVPTKNDDVNWSDPRWLGYANWAAYKAYKASEAHAHAVKLKQAATSQAAAMGLDPDSILMAGNDPPMFFEAAFTGDELDLADYEYFVARGLDTGSQVGHGIPPYGRAGGSYALATRVGRSRHAIVFYYLMDPASGTLEALAGVSNTPYRFRPGLGLVVGYEALASNVLVNGDDGGTAMNPDNIAGTDASLTTVHNTIQRMAPTLGNRVRTGAVAVVYSTETAQSLLAPGGWVGYDNTTYNPSAPSYLDHQLGYYGWTAALEELHVPYRAIPDFRLTSAELAGVHYLILPHVRAIEQSTITNVLLPFLAGGGSIVLTGADSGATHTQAGNYLPNTGPLLAQQLVGQLGVEYRTDNPGFDYHIGRLNPTGAQRVNARNLISALVQWRELTLTPSDPFVLTTEHYDRTRNRWFIDLANLDINITTDTINTKRSMTIQWRLPATFGAHSATGRAVFYDESGGAATLLPTITNNVMTFTVPGLRNWATVAITPF